MTHDRKAQPRGGSASRASESSFHGEENSSILKESRPKTQPRNPRRGGRKPRQKGNRFERALVRLLQDAGLGAERVPLSGSAGGSFSGDVSIPLLGRDLVVEAKARANGFRELYGWLEGRDALIVRADRRDALVVVLLRLAIEIAVVAERGKGVAP
jgi:Holliday junction resolvase